ncbi:hypothetical protein BTO06_12765 [Tenacibaculum sp. SZ-18]|uniref:hypothetical protein n=1 Tax=Tenacibaculum sp. SZ-18 TaxID=754423 RepID=UPI000C2D230B|nr:hypothetical protein [Tenacibaculum sp. SZ-18]AUC15971.1 hypothetical protein BTO06_12765 [Tenacibaculum sp. SZ-18]
MNTNKITQTELKLDGSVIATTNVGVSPAAMVMKSKSKHLYVANSNNYSIKGSDSVTLIDGNTFMPLKTITDSSFNQPFGLTLSKDESKLYVANSNGTTISVIDTETNEVNSIIDGFNGPSAMVIHPHKKIGYVINYGAIPKRPSGKGNTVTVVNLEQENIFKEIQLHPHGESPAAPAAIAITPDGENVYVANYVTGNPGTGTVTKISTSTHTIINEVKGFFGPFSIQIDTEGKNAYVTNFGSNNFEPYGTTVSVLNLEDNSVTEIPTGGIQPSGLALSKDGRFGLVSNYNTLYSSNTPNLTGLTAGQGTVNIIDLQSNKLHPITINVGQAPGSISISPDGKYAFVSNYIGNTVSVIKIYQH